MKSMLSFARCSPFQEKQNRLSCDPSRNTARVAILQTLKQAISRAQSSGALYSRSGSVFHGSSYSGFSGLAYFVSSLVILLL